VDGLSYSGRCAASPFVCSEQGPLLLVIGQQTAHRSSWEATLSTIGGKTASASNKKKKKKKKSFPLSPDVVKSILQPLGSSGRNPALNSARLDESLAWGAPAVVSPIDTRGSAFF
jgi:hypothetical protein